MKEFWHKIKEWWAPLVLREKIVLIFGGCLVILFLVYELLWDPLLNHLDSMRKRIVTDQKTLVWMLAADKQLQALESHLPNKNKVISPVVLLSVAKKRINQAGLEGSLTQLKQVNNDSIELHFEKVDFDSLMKMLIKAIKEDHLTLVRLSVTPENAAGLVNAEVGLK